MEEKYTREQLAEAFEWVCNKKNWKLPINKRVQLTEDKIDLVREAVIYFTGSVPTFAKVDRSMYKVTAAGYYNVIGM